MESTDSIVRSVVEKFLQRSAFGQAKYGTNLDRKDLSVLDWIQHAQEELMDGILYLEKLKKEMSEAQTKAEGAEKMAAILTRINARKEKENLAAAFQKLKETERPSDLNSAISSSPE